MGYLYCSRAQKPWLRTEPSFTQVSILPSSHPTRGSCTQWCYTLLCEPQHSFKKVVRAEININLTGALLLQSYVLSLRLPMSSESQQDRLVLPFQTGMCWSLPIACKCSQLTNLAPGSSWLEVREVNPSVSCPRGYTKRVSGQDTRHKPPAMQIAPLPCQAVLAQCLALAAPSPAVLWTFWRPGEIQPGLTLPLLFASFFPS